ncbi:MAG: CPBP family intramembrane metalloprotease [Clostridia bacterium]|nr:CPBP family intramembrane metalloprotease [Clostridia bacterium]
MMMRNWSGGKRILLFLAMTFAITYIYELLILPPALEANPAAATYLIAVVMLFPALCVLLTRLISREGFRDAWILPHFRGHIRYYLIGWLSPIVLIILGGLLYFLLFPGKFDANMGYMHESYAAAGLTFSAGEIKTQVILQLVLGLLTAPLVNIFFTLGEEWGWRGYLLPKLTEKFSILPTLLISGLIWGLWHAPLIALGHNYGLGYSGFPWTGILAMCAFCLVVGTLFSYITLKTRSCLPAAVAHGSLNGFAAAGIMFTFSAANINPFIGPAPTGIIGGSGFLITALILLAMMLRQQKAGQLIAPPAGPQTAAAAPWEQPVHNGAPLYYAVRSGAADAEGSGQARHDAPQPGAAGSAADPAAAEQE